jgi:hypothetical protein
MSCCLWLGVHVAFFMAAAALAKAMNWRKGRPTSNPQAWRLNHKQTHESKQR